MSVILETCVTNYKDSEESLKNIRRDLSFRAKSKCTRNAKFTKDRPSDWRPTQVTNPKTNEYFTEVSAWEFIVERLEEGHPIEVIPLRKPPGKKGYVIKVKTGIEPELIYIKLQLARSVVFGRSFHYSEAPTERN